MIKVKITKLIFNDGTELPIAPDDIVLFVGPNNAGKSQAIKDIHNLLYNSSPAPVVSKIEWQINEKEELQRALKEFASRTSSNDYVGSGFSIASFYLKKFMDNEEMNKDIVAFLTSFLSTEDRLNLVNPPKKINDNEPRQHPIHYLDRERGLIDFLDKAFFEAFGQHLQLNDYYGASLPLSIGKEVTIENEYMGKRSDKTAEFLRREFANLPLLHNQGDGMKSFTGILLNLFISHYSIFFIDEPESFLHSPQAYVMGQQLVSMSKDKQLFLTTHSDSLLKGLVDSSTNRLKIIRITRTENNNSFAIIKSEEVKKLMNDPLLRYSNILDSLFYNITVACESNADCKFYRMILDSIIPNQTKRKDILFVESGGKQRLNIICEALRSLNVDVRVTPDFDIFRRESEASKLYNSCGGDWAAECAADWKTLEQSLLVAPDEIDRDILRQRIDDYLSALDDPSLGKREMEALKSLIKGSNKWDKPKELGLGGVPDGPAKDAITRLIERFHEKNIYPVLSGEMESLGPKSSKHGKDWVNATIIKHPNPSDQVYDKARAHIQSLKLMD